ncbi:hypothetical protein P879_11725 [Paragonimus westermani]|uniref:Uncharacterized protein n=1 Tax=Paragonimus westermani TaxID=34504 RepID=A0A8T0DC78_9TREM|nr:hypothetical protein P879_11725 [Paragonimus westermani]
MVLAFLNLAELIKISPHWTNKSKKRWSLNKSPVHPNRRCKTLYRSIWRSPTTNILAIDDMLRILDVSDLRLFKLRLEESEQGDLFQLIPLKGETVGFRREIYMRNQEFDELKEAGNMQQVSVCMKPTIINTTNLSREKLAVDTMSGQKVTFVRYRTEDGESHVYITGHVFTHRVVPHEVANGWKRVENKDLKKT